MTPIEKKELVNRLSRIQGQIEGIKKMIDEDEQDCLKVMRLLKASTNALKKFGQEYVSEHFAHCVQDNMNQDEMNTKMKDVIISAFSL